jgi:hypothetical protein
MLIGALALPALPAAAQGKAIGKPAGVGKPTTTTAKGPAVKGKSADAKSATAVKGKSGDHAKGAKPNTEATTDTNTASTDTKALGQKDLAARMQVMMDKDHGLAKRITTVIGDMPLADATANFKNQGQFIAAVNAVEHNPGLTFAALQTEMTTGDKLSLGDAVKKLNAAAATPPAPATTTPTTTTTTPPTTTTPTTTTAQ